MKENELKNSLFGNAQPKGFNKPIEENKETKPGTFTISKKEDDKTDKKKIQVYMDPSLVKDLDSICKKTKYSRNELINMMCEYCKNNIEIE